MNRIDRINERKVGIIGMARSGIAAAKLVKRLNGRPFVSDVLPEAQLTDVTAILDKEHIPYECGGHSDKLLECDYLIVSPGVPGTLGILKKAEFAGMPVFSELELAYWVCRGRVLAVTGSNGKTTTTALLGEICKASGIPTVVGGNIGLPFSEIARDIGEDGLAVIEVSSFQLERTEQFAPFVGVLLNLTPDHLDRYGTFGEYCNAKWRMFENQSPDQFAALNADDPVSSKYDFPYKGKQLFFSINSAQKPGQPQHDGVFERGKRLVARLAGQNYDIVDVDHIRIPGPHNRSNAAAAALAALVAGVKPDTIAEVLRDFSGVEHRLEPVATIGGVNFVNDSKGTNVDAVLVALQSVPRRIQLIAGGRDKAGDFTRLIEAARDKVANMILVGEAREKIFEQVGRDIPVVMASSMEDAVRKAFDLAHPGDTVLLSPGCASFDMYRNYEERGKHFKSIVMKLKNGKGSNQTVEA